MIHLPSTTLHNKSIVCTNQSSHGGHSLPPDTPPLASTVALSHPQHLSTSSSTNSASDSTSLSTYFVRDQLPGLSAFWWIGSEGSVSPRGSKEFVEYGACASVWTWRASRWMRGYIFKRIRTPIFKNFLSGPLFDSDLSGGLERGKGVGIVDVGLEIGIGMFKCGFELHFHWNIDSWVLII